MTVRRLKDCDHRSYQKGCKIPVGASSYPSMAWGSYLPGDEPGYYCELLGGGCNEEGPDSYDVCPRMEQTETPCPNCLEENQGEIFREFDLWLDKDENILYCQECDYFKKL